MEKSEYSFGAYRYFIVPNDQISLFDAIEEKRKKAVQISSLPLLRKRKEAGKLRAENIC